MIDPFSNPPAPPSTTAPAPAPEPWNAARVRRDLENIAHWAGNEGFRDKRLFLVRDAIALALRILD